MDNECAAISNLNLDMDHSLDSLRYILGARTIPKIGGVTIPDGSAYDQSVKANDGFDVTKAIQEEVKALKGPSLYEKPIMVDSEEGNCQHKPVLRKFDTFSFLQCKLCKKDLGNA